MNLGLVLGRQIGDCSCRWPDTKLQPLQNNRNLPLLCAELLLPIPDVYQALLGYARSKCSAMGIGMGTCRITVYVLGSDYVSPIDATISPFARNIMANLAIHGMFSRDTHIGVANFCYAETTT